jgi:tetratricopeptide (TPR) repeat protein
MRAVAPASLLAVLAASPAAASVTRDGGDAEEVEVMRRATPHAVDLLEKGEALGASGAFQEAHALFRQALAEAPSYELLERRNCEALTALGRREEAVSACTRAEQYRAMNVNVRALIRALVAGPTAPSANQLAQALAITAYESQRSPGMATPAEMTCSVAESVGDVVMLRKCTEDLAVMAPNDSETRRAMAVLASRCPPSRFWAGWGAILAAIVLTLAHALRRFALGRRKAGPLVVAAAAALLLTAAAGPAQADPAPVPVGGWLSRWPIDDDHPDKGIPTEAERNADPLNFGYWLQDMAWKAERAGKHGDHAAASRFYMALAQAVPDRAVPLVKACEEYEAQGDLEKAINACGDALLRDGLKVRDYARFIHLVISKPGILGAKETGALANVLQHMRDDPDGREAADELECEVGTRTSNVAQLKECTAGLVARAPDDPRTVIYQWTLAMQEGNFSEAEKLIDRAKSVGVKVDEMKAATAAQEKKRRMLIVVLIGAIALILCGAAFGTRGVLRRRLTHKVA